MELVVGRVGRAHGLHGEVVVEVRTDTPELRFAPGVELSAGDVGPLVVESTRWQNDRLLVRFERVPDRNAAERLRGALLGTDVPDDEQPDDPDEFYDHHLVGLDAVAVGGERLGAVQEVLHLPMQDVLSVRTPDGRELLVPFVADIVPEVDLPGRRVLVDPPDGLIDAG